MWGRLPDPLGAPIGVHADRGVHARRRARRPARTRRCRATRSPAPGVASRIVTVRAAHRAVPPPGRGARHRPGRDRRAVGRGSNARVAGGDPRRDPHDGRRRSTARSPRSSATSSRRRACAPRTAHRFAELPGAVRRPARRRRATRRGRWPSGAGRRSPTRRDSRCPTSSVIGPPPDAPARLVRRRRAGPRRATRSTTTPRGSTGAAARSTRPQTRYGAPLQRARRPARAARRLPRPAPRAAASPRTPRWPTRYEAARDVLWSAPCDLAPRAQLVEEYQHAVRVAVGADPAVETERRRSRRRPS